MLDLTLIAIGKLGRGPEHDLFDHYWTLIGATNRQWRATHIEIDDRKAPSGKPRKAWDADHILTKCPSGATLVCLDERGKTLSSSAIAAMLSSFEERAQPVCFAIGGPDGLDESVRARSTTSLSFGAMTWPHRLARVMLAEQLYRAAAISTGHPYHREG